MENENSLPLRQDSLRIELNLWIVISFIRKISTVFCYPAIYPLFFYFVSPKIKKKSRERKTKTNNSWSWTWSRGDAWSNSKTVWCALAERARERETKKSVLEFFVCFFLFFFFFAFQLKSSNAANALKSKELVNNRKKKLNLFHVVAQNERKQIRIVSKAQFNHSRWNGVRCEAVRCEPTRNRRDSVFGAFIN